jgi:nitrite reductase/ring-hydroxylating ferredoxin subunit
MSSDMASNLNDAIDKVLSDERDVRGATAPHQEEFPYGRDDEAQVTRREFCNFLFLTSGALLASTAGVGAKAAYDRAQQEQFTPANIQGANALQPGEALNFYYPNENDTAILIRDREGNYHAYGQKCTHLTCPVYYSKEGDRLECPCHEGGFDVRTGNVLYGPPPRPLDRVVIEQRGGEVWATGIVRGGDTHGGV